MTMQLRYATVPMPSTTEFARHLNVWLLELCAKIKAGWGLLTPPNWAWEGADGDDDVPDKLYLFHETICAGIRAIDLSFGVDHFKDLSVAVLWVIIVTHTFLL
jgi:hypothetical protein